MRGNIIKSARYKQNMKQNVLSKGICSNSYLSKIENNQVTPSKEILELLYSRLNIKFSLTDENPENIIYHRNFLYEIYENVVQNSERSFSERKLKYLRENKSNYISKEIILDYYLLELYLLLIINTEPETIKFKISLATKNKEHYNDQQYYLFNKCMAVYYNFEKNTKLADSHFNYAWKNISRMRDYNYEQADLAYRHALSKISSNQIYQALEMIGISKKFFSDQFIFSRLAECLLIEGIAYQKLGDLSKAYCIYSNTLKLLKVTNQELLLASVLQHIGSVSSLMNKYDESLNFFLMSYHMKVPTETKLATILSIIQLYSKQKNHKHMKLWINRGLALLENDKISESYHYHFKIYEQLFLKELSDLNFIKDALNYFESINDGRHFFKYGIKLSEQLINRGKYKLATIYYKKAIKFQNENINYWEDL